MKKYLYLVLFLLGFNPSGKAATDSLLSGKKEPFVMLNPASSDCIMCRAAATNILAQLDSEQYISQIILLSDTKGMTFFYKNNEAVFGKYEKLYDPDLSHKYAIDYSSTLCLFRDGRVEKYALTALKDSQLNYIKSVLDTKPLKVGYTDRTVHYVDSLLPGPLPVASFMAYADKAYIFEAQIQAGFCAGIKEQHLNYREPEADTNTIRRMISILKSKSSDSFCGVTQTLRSVKELGLAPVQIKRMNKNNMFFQFNSVYQEMSTKDPTGQHDTIKLAIMGRLFIAINDTTHGIADPFKLESYNQLLYVDFPVNLNNKQYKPLLSDYNYMVDGKQVAILFTQMDKTTWRATDTPDIKLFIYKIEADGLKLDKTIALPYFDKYYYGFFRKLNNNWFFFNQHKRELANLSSGKKISYTDLIADKTDSLTSILDAAYIKGLIHYAGQTKSNTIIKGSLSATLKPTNETTSVPCMEQGPLKTGAVFEQDVLYYYQRNTRNGATTFGVMDR